MHRNWACRKFRQTQFEASLCLFFFFFLFFYGMSFEILGLENCPCGSQSLLKLPLGLSSSPWLASNTRGVKEAVKHEAFTAALYGFLIGFFCYKHSKKMRLTEKKRETFGARKRKKTNGSIHVCAANLFRASAESPTWRRKNIVGWELYWTNKKPHEQL